MHSTTLSSESLMKMYICSQTPVVSWPAREHIGVGAGTDQLHRAGRLHLKVQVHMPPLTRRNLQPFLLQAQPSVFTKTPKENPDKMIARTSKRRRSGRSVRSRNVCAVRYGFVYWIRIFFSFAENCPSNHRQAQCQHQESNRGSTVLPRAGAHQCRFVRPRDDGQRHRCPHQPPPQQTLTRLGSFSWLEVAFGTGQS